MVPSLNYNKGTVYRSVQAVKAGTKYYLNLSRTVQVLTKIMFKP